MIPRLPTRLAVVLALCLGACAPGFSFDPATDYIVAGVYVWDGTGAPPSELAVVQISEGRILSVEPVFGDAAGSADPVDTIAVLTGVLTDANNTGIDGHMVLGAYLIPGLINTHGHVGGTWIPGSGVEYGEYMFNELERYARFGVTTVNSLGGDRELSFALRDASWRGGVGETAGDAGDERPPPRARLLAAGQVVTGSTPEAAVAMVDRVAAMGPDWIKIRVDDNLGATTKMTTETYAAVIARSREHGLRVASHLFYREDAKGLLRAGTGMVAHSIRDEPVDDEVIDLFRETGVCYVPTLTREVSTFAYGDRPDFFDDPFLMSDVDSAQVAAVSDPARRERVRASGAAEVYGRALEIAQANLARLSEAGAAIAFGTDSGPLGRFQGYFEHMEMELMAEGGLTPEQILRSATGVAAECLGRDDIGTIEPGRRADFVIVWDNPLEDVRNLREIVGVWVGGVEVERR
ncbi:MAG: amidohydrolase family protein [Gemmatimonadota bacterium]|nr:amidohydrolase family protein [Gemmatimonadota bacterium]MDE2983758.1 amidohydrolase family protein [Gemmatimonadota bacterium]